MQNLSEKNGLFFIIQHILVHTDTKTIKQIMYKFKNYLHPPPPFWF